MNNKIIKIAAVLITTMLVTASAVAAPKAPDRGHAPARQHEAPKAKKAPAPAKGKKTHTTTTVVHHTTTRGPTPSHPARHNELHHEHRDHGHHKHHRHHDNGTLHTEDWITIGVGLIGGVIGGVIGAAAW